MSFGQDIPKTAAAIIGDAVSEIQDRYGDIARKNEWAHLPTPDQLQSVVAGAVGVVRNAFGVLIPDFRATPTLHNPDQPTGLITFREPKASVADLHQTAVALDVDLADLNGTPGIPMRLVVRQHEVPDRNAWGAPAFREVGATQLDLFGVDPDSLVVDPNPTVTLIQKYGTWSHIAQIDPADAIAEQAQRHGIDPFSA